MSWLSTAYLTQWRRECRQKRVEHQMQGLLTTEAKLKLAEVLRQMEPGHPHMVAKRVGPAPPARGRGA
jgi:hypothetical protein